MGTKIRFGAVCAESPDEKNARNMKVSGVFPRRLDV